MVRANWFEVLRSSTMNLLVPIFLLCPKVWLRRFLTNAINRQCFDSSNRRIEYFKSGRSAIVGCLKALRESGRCRNNVILIPNYICNVVTRACVAAGWRVEEYLTNDDNSPNWDDVESRYGDSSASALLIVSMTGSVPAASEELIKFRDMHKDVVVISDECQNLNCNNPVFDSGVVDIAISSFNNKTCPGVMGGFVAYAGDEFFDINYDSISFVDLWLRVGFLFGYWMKSMIRNLLAVLNVTLKRQTTAHECAYLYSSCSSLHYDLKVEPIYKLSLVKAVQNIKRLEHFSQLRDVYGKVKLVPPYVLRNTCVEVPVVIVKNPYARDSDPTVSNGPNRGMIDLSSMLFTYERIA